MNEPFELPVPEVPDFEMIRPVGSGGFGEVWLATNRTTGHLRAVKIIPLQQPGQANAASREISSLTRLEANVGCRHPNLLQIHHVGKTAIHLFYVMDPADDLSGGPASNRDEYQPATLQARLQRKKGTGPICAKHPRGRSGKWDLSLLPPELCLDYSRQLLAGLASLHAAGMAHRDVKPANCLFVGGVLKLADFGLLTESHPLVSRLGTRKYMPPDGRMDMRADVYAAGLVIYEMLSGLPVDDFPRLGQRSREIAANPTLASLLRLVLRACEREPEKRFADARAMLAELDASPKPSRLPKRRVAVACVAAVLAMAGLTWMLVPGRVDVSFVTEPYEASIYLDDTLVVDPAGSPYTTPCTVSNLPAGNHRVAFQWPGQPRWDAGEYDFSKMRQIVTRRGEAAGRR